MALKSKKPPKGIEVREVPLVWVGLDEIPVRTVTNAISQGAEDGLFTISFGYTNAPALIGSKSEIRKQLEGITSVSVSPVVRIALTESQLAKTIKTLQTTLKRYRTQKADQKK